MLPKHAKLVRKVLDEAEGFLQRESAHARLQIEADMQALLFRHLSSKLSDKDDRWVIGCTHTFSWEAKKWKPDIVCYRVPWGNIQQRMESVEKFLKQPAKYIVAIVEMKHANQLGDDLNKLRSMQTHFEKVCKRPILAWMIYGGHFNSSIHRANCKEEVEKRAQSIEKWVAQERDTRGCTILKFGLPQNRDTPLERKVRELLNGKPSHQVYWIRDN